MKIMKIICALLACMLAIAFSLSGCGDRQEKGYLKTAIEQKARIQKIVLLKTAKDAILMYRVKNQKWPDSLDEVNDFPKLPQDQKWEWVYDNTNGNIDIKDNRNP